jgi:hypothetical protein
MTCNVQNFCVAAGETWHPTIPWSTDTYVSVPITGISQAAPVTITAPGHAMPDGWPCAVVGAQGMTQINAERYPPAGSDWQKGHAIDPDTVQLNAVSSAGFTPWTSGGFLVYPKPGLVAGMIVTLTIWGDPNDTNPPLVTLSSNTGGIALDMTLMTITPTLQTASLPWTTGYYRLDATDASGNVTQLAQGTLTIE